jgi:hypothetical protein
MAFSDDMIRAIVKTGRYTDPAAEKLLADVLIKRRNKIGRVYYSRINPLVNFSLDSAGMLKFENPATHAGIVETALHYQSVWSIFNNDTGASTPIGEAKSSSEQIAAPGALPETAGAFVMAEIRAIDAPHAAWAAPVRVTFRRTDRGWKLVGVQRTL